MINLVSVALCGCVTRPVLDDLPGDEASDTTEPGGTTSGSPTTSGSTVGTQPATDESGTPPATTTTGSPDSATAQDDTCGFICDPETEGPTTNGCDVYAQDCPEGEKCAPYNEGGGSDWNATKCVPVTGDGQPGDPCTAIGGGVSGLDDCAEGIYCWDVDRMGHGECIEMCSGDEAAPVCKDEKAICQVTADSILDLCIRTCDPLIQDCPGDGLCIPVGDTFVCAPDASPPDAGAVFDPCEFANACDKGLLCLNPSSADECDQDAGGCCMPFCDLTKPNMCPGVGVMCISLYEKGMAPPEFEHVGTCAIPG